MSSALDTLRAAIEAAIVTAWRGVSAGTVLVDQANVAIGDVTVHMDGITTLPALGEVFQVAGDTQYYAISSVSVLTGTDADIGFTPPARIAWANDAAVTLLRTPIEWPNVGLDRSLLDGPWLRPAILWGDGRPFAGGAGVAGNRIAGVLSFSLFDIQGRGLGYLYTYADVLRTAFSRALISTAQFLAPSGPRIVPEPEESEWAHMVITCPFETSEA